MRTFEPSLPAGKPMDLPPDKPMFKPMLLPLAKRRKKIALQLTPIPSAKPMEGIMMKKPAMKGMGQFMRLK